MSWVIAAARGEPIRDERALIVWSKSGQRDGSIRAEGIGLSNALGACVPAS